MPNPLAIKKYLAAKEAYDKGEHDDAAQLLAESLGAEHPSSVIEHSLGRLLEVDTLANDAILGILASETSKREKTP